MSKWEILHGAGDVAVYNGLKKIFHVFPEEAEIVVKILNDLEDELARCKSERLTPMEFNDILRKTEAGDLSFNNEWLIELVRASQQTQEGKG